MELKEAYKKWGLSQEGKSLYHNTRTVFSKAWAKLYQGKPCEFYTLEKLSEALAKPSLFREERAKAASAMVHVLQFAHKMEPKVNPEPSFTYEELIHASTQPKVDVQEKPKIDVKELNSVPYTGEALPKKGPKSSKRVCQVDIIEGRLKLVKEFSSVSQAQKALHIMNVGRAADRKARAGAWYWCYAEEFFNLTVNDFKRSKVRKAREKKDNPIKVEESTEGKVITPQEEHLDIPPCSDKAGLKACSDEELIAELRSRGWRGPICKIVTVDL